MLKKFLLLVTGKKLSGRTARRKRLLERTYEACRNFEADNARSVLQEILFEENEKQYEAAQIGYFTSPKSIRNQAKSRRRTL